MRSASRHTRPQSGGRRRLRWLTLLAVPALAALGVVAAGHKTATPSSATRLDAAAAPADSSGLPAHVLMGYWQDFTNGATPLTLADVPTSYNLVAVAFGNAGATPGQVTFSLDSGLSSALGGYTDSQFTSDIQTLHSRGQKVILSVGGQNGTVSVTDSASASEFASSVDAIINQYGFDGVDIDLENGVNPTYMAQALQQLQSDVGSSLIITLAPQTIDTQSAGSDYLALALNIKSILTMINTQYYNSGTMNGCDGNVYAEGSVDFITALACTELQSGLSPAQVGIGLPAFVVGGRQRLRGPVGGQQRAGLPGRPDQLRQLHAVGQLPGPARRDDLVDQLGRR